MRRLTLLVVLLAGCGGQSQPRVRQVDPFPLYELTSTAPTPSLARASGGGACTVFVDDGVLARNFDFDDHPALLLHHRPPGAHRSVSLVDIAYLGVERGEQPTAADLAGAARLPFDGMNERGVAVAMAAVPEARTPRGDAVGSLGVMRLVLDRAADVDDAIAIFRRTAIDFTGGPPLHYMVADPDESAVIEYVRGRVHVLRDQRVMTNFVLTGDAPADDRYRTASAGLGSTAPLRLLERVKQPHTRWSVAYDLRARTLRVVMGQRYGRVHTFSL